MFRKSLVSLMCSLFVLTGCISTNSSDEPTHRTEPLLPWLESLLFTVPDYIGMSLAQAKQESSDKNVIFEVTYLDETALQARFGSERANWPGNNIILTQHPAPQYDLFRDEERVVKISIADWEAQTDSAAPLTMPDLRLKPEAVAQLKITPNLTVKEFKASLKEVIAAYGPNVNNWPEANSVVSFLPAVGQVITTNQVEISYIDKHASYWQGQELRNLVGQTKQKAQVTLDEIGLPYSVNLLNAASIASQFGRDLAVWPATGTVIGYTVDTTDQASVAVNVANWQKEQFFPKPVPILTGLSVGEAKTLLDNLGYASTIQQLESAEQPETVLIQHLQLSNDITHGEVLMVVAADEVQDGFVEVVAPKLKPVTPIPIDSDFDGVPDAKDICSKTERTAFADEKGCSAGDLVKHLEYGIYKFQPDSREMEAERQEPYKVTITLQTAQNMTPRLTIRPTLREFDELTGKVPESLEAIESQAKQQVEIPHIIERWSSEMTLKLEAVNKEAAVINPERIKRLVERGKTEWIFKVFPKCVGTFSCDPLILEVSALAHLGADKPIPLFEGERFMIRITMDTLIASFLDKWGVVFFSAIIAPIFLLWLGKRFFGRNGS